MSKWCSGCRKLKILEKKEKHKLTKGYQKARFKTLHKRCWTIFSQWVRVKTADSFGMVTCYSCNDSIHYKQANAGHFFHGKLDFDERNVKPQCVACNLYKSGNLAPYSVKLAQELGLEGLQQLRTDANQNTYSTEDIETLIKIYQAKLSP